MAKLSGPDHSGIASARLLFGVVALSLRKKINWIRHLIIENYPL
jgi:hypothetical protein